MSCAPLVSIGESVVAKLLHQGQRIWLKQRFAAGQLDEGHTRRQGGIGRTVAIRLRQFVNSRDDVVHQPLLSFGERVGGVAVGAAQVARGQPDEHARKSSEGAFTLEAQIDFVDDQRFRHRGKV